MNNISQYESIIQGIAKNMGNPSMQDDLVSVMRLKLLEYDGDIDDEKYIKRILRNSAIDYLRKENTCLGGVEKNKVYNQGTYNVLIDEDIDIEDLISCLPKQNLAIILLWSMGYTHRQIAELFKTTAKAINNRISRSKNEITKLYNSRLSHQINRRGAESPKS